MKKHGSKQIDRLPGGRRFKKGLSVALAALMLTPCAPAFARSVSKQARRDVQVKAAIRELGTGRYARVLVTFRDKRKVEGFVAGSEDNFFRLGNLCTGDIRPVKYGQVKSLWGKDTSTGMKVTAGVGVFSRIRGAPDLPPCRGRRGLVTRPWRTRSHRMLNHARLIGLLASTALIVIVYARVLSDPNF